MTVRGFFGWFGQHYFEIDRVRLFSVVMVVIFFKQCGLKPFDDDSTFSKVPKKEGSSPAQTK